MKIRDAHAVINGDKTEFELPSGGLDVIADDGRPLFHVSLSGSGIEISANGFCKHKNLVLGTRLSVKPGASNAVYIEREEYKD